MNFKDLLSSLFTYTPDNKETYNFNLVEDLNTKIYPDSTLGNEGNEKTKIFPSVTVNTDYLKSKYKGAEPTKRDLQLIEELMIDQKLSAGVVNVIISYALKINNQKLNRNYLETIAGQWKRLNIETVEEAMRLTEKEYKKMKKIAQTSKPKKETKKKVTEEILPDWFNKELDTDNSNKEDNEELSKIIDSLV